MQLIFVYVHWQVEMYQDKNFRPLQKLFREWNMKSHLQSAYLSKNVYQDYLQNSENSVVENNLNWKRDRQNIWLDILVKLGYFFSV